jgi:hypothetical protein
MSRGTKLRKERSILSDRIKQIDGELADLIAQKEKADDTIAAKRDRLDDNPTEQRREELKREIDKLIVARKEAKARVHELRPRLEKAQRRIKKIARILRNLASPKYVDLAFDRTAVGGLTRQPYIAGSVGHYTAGPLDDDDDEAFELWRRYDAAHKAQGWVALGYNVGVTRNGTIVRLRGPEYVGAHTLNYNTGQVGISVHGTTGDTWAGIVQRRALRALLKKYDLTNKPLIGHWQAPGQSTACPGSFLKGYTSKGKTQ